MTKIKDRRNRLYRFIVLVAFVLFLPLISVAQDEERFIQARILSGYAERAETDIVPAGVEMTLEPGWYTYWRTPGDSGLPLQFDWNGSKNVKDVKVHWPAPKRFKTAGLNSFGYDETVVLPLDVTLEDKSKTALLSLTLQALVCKEICVPQEVIVEPVIIPGDSVAAQDSQNVRRAFENLPEDEETKTLKLQTAVLGQDALVFTSFSENGFDEKADIFIETEETILTDAPEITVDTQDSRRAVIKVPAPEGVDNLTDLLFGQKATVTFVNGEEAIEKVFGF